MTKTKRIRLIGLFSALLLGGLSAYYRVQMASYGTTLVFGGIGYSPGLLFYAIAICVLAFLIAAIKLSTPENSELNPPGVLLKSIIAVSGIGTICASIFFLLEASDFASYMHVIFAAICGVALLARTVSGEGGIVSGLLSLFPVYYLFFLLMGFYRANASNPSTLSFCLELLTIIAIMLAVYVLSSLKFEKTSEPRRVFLCLLAMYFVTMEALCLILKPSLILSVAGISNGLLLILLSMGVYTGAGLFLMPSVTEKRRVHAEASVSGMASADSGNEPQFDLKQIITDDLFERSTDQLIDANQDELQGNASADETEQ